jgi:hypothetical protein
VQLDQVVGDGDQVQLPEHVFGSPQQETVQPTGHLNGVGAADAGIREQLVRKLPGVGEDPLQHGQQMGFPLAWLLIPTATITWWAPSTATWQL